MILSRALVVAREVFAQKHSSYCIVLTYSDGTTEHTQPAPPRWFRRKLFLSNFFPHRSQWNGLCPPWIVRRCVCKFDFRPNCFWHTSHLNGFFPSWTVWRCICKTDLWPNCFWHKSHWNGLSPIQCWERPETGEELDPASSTSNRSCLRSSILRNPAAQREIDRM